MPLGRLWENAKNVPFQYFFVTFFGTVMGVPFVLVSIANLVILFIDALSDPIMGSISDNWRSKKWGRRHFFMWISIIPFGLGMFFMFAPPEGLSNTALMAWMIGFAVLVRISLTLFVIPYLTLNAELTDDYEERTELSTYRALIGNMVAVVLAVLAFMVFLPDAAGNMTAGTDTAGLLNTSGYVHLSITCGIVGMVAAVIAILGTRKEIPRLNQKCLNQQYTPIKADLKSKQWWAGYIEFGKAFRNKAFRTLILGYTCFSLMAGLATVMTTYLLNYFWGLELKQTAIIVATMGIAIIPGAAFAPWLARKFDKKNTILFLTAVYVSIYVIPIALRLVGMMPANDTDALLYSLIGIYFFGQIFVIGILVISESMMSDVTDDYQLLTGKRQEGMLFSGIMFARKASFGVGGSLAGFGLALINFPTKTAPADVPPEALFNLGLFFAPAIFVLLLGAFVSFLGYPLTREKHAQTLEKLSKLKNQK